MQVSIKGKDVDVTPAMREYAEKKLQKLTKYFSEIKEARVVQTVQKNTHVIEVLLEGDGILLRGEERSESMYTSIDMVVEKLEQRVKKFKGKLYGRSHERGPKEKEALREKTVTEAQTPEEGLADGEEYEPVIERTKRFAVKPMAPEEAARQMELLHHDFFVFVNSESSQVSVVYRRKRGGYGLLEPDF
jgi:putative sigma-54 modulation protein